MSLSDLCREFGVSRSTGYRWINRYKEVGPEGLLDLSRKPHGCSHATSEVVENAILALRNKHPSWGARKLKARFETLQPKVIWPAASTFGNILSRAGLTNPKQKKRRTTPYSEPFSTVTAANQLWCMNFKGLLQYGRRRTLRSFHHHRRLQPLSHPLPDSLAHGPKSGCRGLRSRYE
nr:helix-turn-helix domain-containing protein [Acidipila sp. EB88]